METKLKRPPIVVVLGHVDHGKCVTSNTLISLSDGRLIKVSDLYDEIQLKGKENKVDDGTVVREFGLKHDVFSFDGKGVSTSPIIAAWKLSANKNLLRIKLASGDEVEVTPEHPFFVFTKEGKVVEKRADALKDKDFVLVPKNLNFKSSLAKVKADIYKKLTKKNANWVIHLNRSNSKYFVRKIKAYGESKLTKSGVLTTGLSDGKQMILRLRAWDYSQICSLFSISLPKAYEMIESVKNASQKWRAGHTSPYLRLPKTKNDFEKLGYIVGCLIGDGFIPEGVLDNNDKEIHSEYIKFVKKVFGINAKVIKGHTCQRVVTTGGKTYERFLTDILGLPNSKKSAIVSIPSILQSYIPLIKSLIEGWFDTDGFVSSTNHQVEFTSKSELLVRQSGFYLLNWGIHSSIYEKNGYWNLRIANDPYLKIFLDNFKPRMTRKLLRIKKAVEVASTSRIFDESPIEGGFISKINYSNEKIPYFDRYKSYKNLSRVFLRKLLMLDLLQVDNGFRAVMNTQVSPVRVTKIDKFRPKEDWVYDFTVDKTHNFIANRVIVHNTTLLDALRKSDVAGGEAGGITQSIGASVVSGITFIDTPGHAAFTKMRSRGANVADIAILVVAMDDGVAPQTKEALQIIRDAKIPFVVAGTKADVAGTNPEVTKGELEKEEVLFEGRGGDVPFVAVSAKTETGLKELLDVVTLMSEVIDLKGDPASPLEAVVIESGKENMGPVASVVIRNGSIKQGETIFAEETECKVRALFDYTGKVVKEVMPGFPARIIGFSDVPPVGASVTRETHKGAELVAKAKNVFDLRRLSDDEIPVIIKAGNEGSLEAIIASLPPKIIVVDSEVGDVNSSDVLTAKTGDAYVFAFESKIPNDVAKLAEAEGVRVKRFEIIYELLAEIDGILKKGKVEETGRAEIVASFPFNDKTVAGCKVKSGRINKGDVLVLMREEKEIGKGKASSLKKLKLEVTSVGQGEEFGVIIEPQLDFVKGDVLVSVRNG